jgi:2-dehydro-3-deoxygalactonokinase
MGTDRTKLIALDWGTSSLRCYRLADSAELLEARNLPLGVMRLRATGPATDAVPTSRQFEKALMQACGDWIDAPTTAPLVACGMIGSSLGWREITYLDVPVDSDRLAAGLGQVRTSWGKTIHIVPGLIERAALPNVMRGEETQVVGALNSCSHVAAREQRGGEEFLIGLPGTHSKWVDVEASIIEHFDTFMTGELYRLLCEHSILSRSMQPGKQDVDYSSFDRGLRVARESAADGAVLSTIFSVRTLGLTGALAPEQQSDYLSGLLIGHEIAAVLKLEASRRNAQHAAARPILLAGGSFLCARYARALGVYGCEDVEYVANATERGLWILAEKARLIASSPPP